MKVKTVGRIDRNASFTILSQLSQKYIYIGGGIYFYSVWYITLKIWVNMRIYLGGGCDVCESCENICKVLSMRHLAL